MLKHAFIQSWLNRFKTKTKKVRNKWIKAGKKAGAVANAKNALNKKRRERQDEEHGGSSPTRRGESNGQERHSSIDAAAANATIVALQRMEARLATQIGSSQGLLEARLAALEIKLASAE